MNASRVILSREIRQQLANPVLDRKKRRQLRVAKIQEYVNSKRAGSKFQRRDLMYVAGYDPSITSEYSKGYALITGMVKRGELWIEDTKLYKKQMLVPNHGVKVTQPAKPVQKDEVPINSTETKVADEPSVNEPVEKSEQMRINDNIDEIESKAKQFAWNNNSDSLREFIQWLK